MDLAFAAARALEDKLGRDIRILDVRAVSGFTDYCVIVSGTSAPHLKALANEAQHCVKALGMPARRSGLSDSGWVVLDCLDAVIHIFAPEARTYYAIETLLSAAPVVPLPPAAPAARRRADRGMTAR